MKTDDYDPLNISPELEAPQDWSSVYLKLLLPKSFLQKVEEARLPLREQMQRAGRRYLKTILYRKLYGG